MNLLQKFKSTGFLLFLFVFLCCAIFYSPGVWNQAARDDMVYSVVENGTFSIDRFMVYPKENYNTGDWARYNGHYYSNKAPGSSFIGILAYFPVYHLEKTFLEKITYGWDIFNAYWINLWASVIPTALAAFVLFKLLLLLGLSERRSFFFALCYAMATPIWPYSTMHWGHPTAAAFLIFSLYFLLKGNHSDLCRAGFFGGCAVLTEYSAILAVACFGIYLLISKKKECLFFISGGLLPAIIYMWYHYVCFGSPFANAASFSNPVFIEQNQFLGLLGEFHPFYLLRLLFSTERGLFLLSPVLIFAFPGTYYMWKGKYKYLVFVLWGWCISGLVLNSSFNGWYGGHCILPRYLIFTLPALCILCAFYRPKEKSWNILLFLLALLSIGNMLVVTIASPLYESPVKSLLYGQLWGDLFTEKLRYINTYGVRLHALQENAFFLVRRAQISLFRYTGIGGIDLIPLLTFSSIFYFLLRRRFNIGEFYDLIRKGLEKKLHREYTISFSSMLIFFIIGILFIFLFPGNVKWICDEPHLFGIALKHYLQGDFPRAGLVGTFGNAYGPLPVIFYQLSMLFSLNPITIAVMKIIVSGGLSLYCLFRISKLNKWNPMLPMTLFLLIPWTWHYTQSLWDNVFLLNFSLLTLWGMLEFSHKGNPWYYFMAVASAVCGVWTHSMALPLLGGAGLFSLYLIRKHTKTVLLIGLPLGLVGAGILFSRYLSRIPCGNAFESVDFYDAAYNSIMYLQIISSKAFIKNILAEPVFQKWYWHLLENISLYISIFFFAIAIYVFIKKGKKQSILNTASQGILLSCGVFFVQTLFVFTLKFIFHPHYLMAVIPFALYTVCYGINVFKKIKIRRLLLYCFLTANAIIILAVIIFVDLNGGTRNLMYGYTLSNQREAVQKVYPTFAQFTQTAVEPFGLYQITSYQTPFMLLKLMYTENFLWYQQKQTENLAKIQFKYIAPAPSAFIQADISVQQKK